MSVNSSSSDSSKSGSLFVCLIHQRDFDKDLDFANGTHSGTRFLQSIQETVSEDVVKC